VRAALFYGKHDLRVEDIPIPTIAPDEVLIRVAFCGICGSDVHTFEGMQMNIHNRPPGPRVIGHEVSGVVAEIGSAVTTCRVGEEVACIPWVVCGNCAYCRKGLVNHCTSKKLLGGAMAEYVVAPQGSVYPLPPGVTLKRAVLSEPISCCVWAVDLGQPQSGSAVAIIGAGAMGLVLLLLGQHGGAAQTIVSEPNPIRRALAESLGATVAVNPREQDLAQAVKSASNGLGADVAFEAVGHPSTVQDAIRIVRNAGTVVLVGVTDPAATLPLSPYEVYQRELTIKGCLTRRLSFDRALRWLPTLNLDPIITHVFPLSDAATAMEHARLGKGGKIVIAPNE